ncbi:hypothetical protein N8D56_06365 [Devosia sp. A8/3-2]|nr:hypothetical protein N8D56_06365 [Devosia sp. A8/3-2]
MTETSPQDLTDLSNYLYGAVFDDTMWAKAAEVVRRATNSQHAALGFFDSQTRQQSMLHGDCAPEFEHSYRDLVDINPLARPMQMMALGTALVDQQVVAHDDFERSAFFDLWMRPQQMHSAMIHKISTRRHQWLSRAQPRRQG